MVYDYTVNRHILSLGTTDIDRDYRLNTDTGSLWVNSKMLFQTSHMSTCPPHCCVHHYLYTQSCCYNISLGFFLPRDTLWEIFSLIQLGEGSSSAGSSSAESRALGSQRTQKVRRNWNQTIQWAHSWGTSEAMVQCDQSLCSLTTLPPNQYTHSKYS